MSHPCYYPFCQFECEGPCPHFKADKEPVRANCSHSHVRLSKETGWFHCSHCKFPMHPVASKNPWSEEDVGYWFAMHQKNNKPEIPKWDQRFLDHAELVASWSKDPSTKCGAVIVRPDKTIASVGFNGFPKGCDDSPEIYANRELKYLRVIHAEMNAILNCYEKPVGYTMYTFPPGTAPSCVRCTAHIIQAGITKVVHKLDRNPPHDFNVGTAEAARQMYREAGVKVVDYE